MFRRKHRRPKVADDPGSELVELMRVGSVEAELIAGRLRSAGIDVAVFGTGAAGYDPGLDFVEGARVMVRRRDAEEASAVLAE